jgi:hypothetical protein
MAKWLVVLGIAAVLFSFVRLAIPGAILGPGGPATPADPGRAVEPVRAVHTTIVLLSLLIVAGGLF